MAQLITVHLNKSDQQPLGFRLQGGKDFGTPLVVQKVNGGSAAERAGLQAGDALIRVNNTEVYTLRHQEAQDTIRAAGTILELTVQRGGNTWRPSVTPTGSLPRAGSRPLGAAPIAVTNTSLKATPQPSRAFGSGHNNVAKPFGYMNGSDSVKSIVNKQYNTPVNIYSDKTIAETLSAQTEVLAGGVLGVNFKKNEKTYDAEKSAVFKVLQEEQNDPEPVEVTQSAASPVSGLRHVQAPVTRPDAPVNNTGGLPPGQNICEECERLITGVFVRIKDKNLHVECFKCSTCGTSLKNQGYYNLNGKLYCDIHAKLVARQNPPAPNLEPVTVPPGGRIPTNAYSTPLPPLATNNYTNGSSSLFSPNSNISGPKPFGSSIGSAYSPSLSPRSAPLSPARPLAAPAPAPVAAPALVTAPAPAPYAPTQNVKSIVWPPPNPPDNIVSPIDSSEPKSTNIIDESIAQTMQIERESTKNIDNLCHIDNIHQKTTQQTLSSSKQFSEFASSVSCASATLSAGATASTKSESLSKSKQSSETHESTCVIQSFSEKESSEKQSVNIYHSKTSAPVEKLYENTLNNTNECVQNTEKIEHTADKSEPLIDQQSSKTESSYTEQFHNETMNLQKKIETSSFPTNIQDVQENKQEPLKINENEFQNNSNNDKSCYENISTISNKDNKIEISNNVNISINSATQNVVQGTGLITSMRDALTTAPDHPYSPLPSSNLINSDTKIPNELHIETSVNKTPDTTEISNVQLPQISQPSPIFIQQSKRGISPIPPITMYTPPEQKQVPIPMPEETQPYIPPDFKINIETKVSREETSSPMVEALTTAPNRSFTPVQIPTIQRGSLRDALTIAPDQPYTSLNIKNQSTSYTSTSSTVQSTVTDILKPIATQSSTCVTNKTLSEFSNSIQNTCQLQSSTDMSAFRPVTKQIFPPLQPEEFCQLSNFPPISDDLKSSFKQSINSKQETVTSETIQHCAVTSSMCTQGFSSIKNAQNYFEQLNQKESLSSINIRSKSGLHKPDDIPFYQKNFERLPSQRGITPEICTAPAVLQRPVTPTTDPPNKSRDKSLEPKQNMNIASPQMQVSKHHQLRTPVQQTPNQFCHKDTPISMTFQPVIDDNLLTISPARSRPTTPSLINKPAPIIPHYQMNLVTVEYSAPESHLYEPSSREASRSPTPKARSRSPAPGPPPNPLKAQAPRLKETTPQRHGAHSLLTQATSNLRKENEMSQKEIKRNTEVLNPTQSCISGQPLTMKEEKYSNFGYNREHYNKGDLNITEDAVMNQNYGKKQTQSHNVSEYGNKTVQTTRKTFEEFEKTQSAKVIEIRKGAPSSEMYQQPESNIRPSNVNFNQVFPPPVISTATIQHSSANLTNESVVTTSRSIENYQTNPSISGANQDPVCDPTPSTGSSVGAAARGKAFGVSSAPKRGRGVLNKAAVPGSRVPLCASCNGNIRANEMQSINSTHRTEFKSPAEERLLRKMAKMALNGYEIGIQRKIKPADHIQSMADKIQDTVVTKHPLNTDSSSNENGYENTLKQPLNKIYDKGYKTQENIQNIGDKIKETIIMNHPAAVNFMNGNIPPPPPIPNTPVPHFNSAQSTPIDHNSNKNSKNIDPKNLNTNLVIDTNITGKLLNNSRCSSTEDLSLKNNSDNYYSNTLRKKEVFEKSAFLNGMNVTNNDVHKTELKLDNNYSNTLTKKKIFETQDIQNSINTTENINKYHDKSTNSLTETNTSNKAALYEKFLIENGKSRQNQENIILPGSSKKIYDNTLYTYKTSDLNSNINGAKKDTEDLINDIENEPNNIPNGERSKDEAEPETIVRRRQKRNPNNDDGRRDSHIVARPLSTMTSTDVADGHYPVCHKCDKAITRGPFITALGRIWCPEHFVCVNATCRRHLQDIGFVEENGQLYCEYCFEQYIAPACDKCHAKIKGDCLNAIGKHFHPECFNCVYCGKLFGNNPFFLEDGLPYCEADWNELFTTKCFACGFPVEAGDRWVEALNNNYHSQCFNCTVCKKNLEGQSFFAKGGRPFCKTHAR